MLLLLPPSEGKTPAPTGEPLDLDRLSFPALNHARETVLHELVSASARPDACELLGVGASLVEDVRRNLDLHDIPAVPAISTYTGVLFTALDVPHVLVHHARHLENVYVSSALFGIVNALDRIPAYRLGMKTKLGELGNLGTWWRKQLAPVLDPAFAGRLVVDCRSTDYRRSWPGDPALTVLVNVYTEKNGKRSVVSHNAKHTRGLVSGHLLAQETLPETAETLVEVVGRAFTVEYTGPVKNKPGTLDVILPG